MNALPHADKRAGMSPLLVIFLTVFLDLLGFGIIIPLLPFYATKFGASPFEVGLLAAAFSTMQFFFAPVWGRLSDRIGRRPVILVGVLGTGVAMLLFAFAESLWLLFASRLFAGIAGANISAAQAYIADVTTPKDRAKGMGLIGAAFGLGFILGPAAGGLLGQWSHRAPGLFAAVVALLNFVFAYVVLPESRSAEEKQKARAETGHRPSFLASLLRISKTHPQVGLLYALFFSLTLAFANLEGTFALLTAARLGFDSAHVGYVFVYVGVIAAVIQGGLIGRLSRRFGEPHLLLVGSLLLAIGMFLLSIMHSVSALLVAVTFTSVGNGLNVPSVSSFLSKLAPEDERGLSLGVMQSLGALGRMLGPALGGYLFGLSDGAPYWFGSGLFVVGALMVSGGLLPRLRIAS